MSRRKAFSPTLASFEPYIALYEKYIPEKVKVEKRLSEIKEYGKSKRVKKEMPRYPEKVVLSHLVNNPSDPLGLYDGRNEMVSNRFHRGEKATWEMEEDDK